MDARLRRVVGFLKEYKALCDRYQMYIDSCGHCNSPWVVTRDVGPYEVRPDSTDSMEALIEGAVSHLVDEIHAEDGEGELNEASKALVSKALGL